MENADERFRELPPHHRLVVPSEVVTQVQIQRPIPVESDQRAGEVVEDVESARVDAEHFSDRADDESDESKEGGVV